MTTSLAPPPFPERLLRATVRDPEWRDAISGDLREEFAAIAAARGGAAARRWYWRQTLPLAARFLAGRLLPSVTPARHRIRVADIEHAHLLGSGWGREWRHAWRALGQRPGLTAVMVVTLGVTLAANAVVFNLADALYLRPFRFPDVDRLVMIASDAYRDGPFLDKESVAPADFRDWTSSLQTVGELAAAEWWDPNLSGIDVPEQIAGFRVTPGFFELLGAPPLLGRTFSPEDGQPEAHRRVLLSHAFWTRQFAADPAVLGRTIRLDGESHEIAGVMPPRFAIPYGADVWAPLALDEAGWRDRQNGRYMTFGRLREGQTRESAQAELNAVAARLAAEFPATNRGRPATVLTFTRGLGDDLVGPLVAIWQAAAVLLLLVGCANLANLLLARGAERQPEFAVRLALGAGRARLCAQLLIEGLAVASLGLGVAGVLTVLATRLTRDFIPTNLVRFVAGFDFIRLDLATLAALGALGAVATVVFSLLPALYATRDAAGIGALGAARVSTAGVGRQWGRTMLSGVQVALALALSVGAAFIVDGVDAVTERALGFDKTQMLTAGIRLPERKYDEAERRRQFAAAVLARLETIPAVDGAALVSSVPFGGSNSDRFLAIEGRPADNRQIAVGYQRVSPAYFGVMRIPSISGRLFDDGDRADAVPVVLVSESFAETQFPGHDGLGRRIRLGDDPTWLTVVGVVGDVVQDPIGGVRPTAYRPWPQAPTFEFSVVTRTSGPPLAVARDLRTAVAAVDPDQPVTRLMAMDALNAERLAGIDYFAKLLLVMSGVGLVLALTGTYSLVSFLAARRTRELSVRIALGATPRHATWLGARGAAIIGAVGVVAGAALALLLGRVMQSALSGFVTPRSETVILAGCLVMALTTVAGYIPARRAARRDPWVSLRAE